MALDRDMRLKIIVDLTDDLARKGLELLGNQVVHLGNNFKKLGSDVGGLAGGALNQVGNVLQTIGLKVAAINPALVVLGAAFLKVGQAVINFAGAALHASDQMDRWRIAFTVMLGSAEQAEILMAKLSQFAKETPFELPQVVKGAQNLMAMGIAARDLIPTMKMLGDLAQGDAAKYDLIALAYGQVAAKGKLMGQEIRQFAENGIPIVQALAKHFGVTTEAVYKMSEQGKISFGEMKKALEELSSGKFKDLMVASMDTVTGKVSNVKDEFFRLLTIIGDILAPIAKDALGGMVSGLEGVEGAIKVVAVPIAYLINAFRDFTAVGMLIWDVYSAVFNALTGLFQNIAVDIAKIAATISYNVTLAGLKMQSFFRNTTEEQKRLALAHEQLMYDLDSRQVPVAKKVQQELAMSWETYSQRITKNAADRNKVLERYSKDWAKKELKNNEETWKAKEDIDEKALKKQQKIHEKYLATMKTWNDKFVGLNLDTFKAVNLGLDGMQVGAQKATTSLNQMGLGAVDFGNKWEHAINRVRIGTTDLSLGMDNLVIKFNRFGVAVTNDLGVKGVAGLNSLAMATDSTAKKTTYWRDQLKLTETEYGNLSSVSVTSMQRAGIAVETLTRRLGKEQGLWNGIVSVSRAVQGLDRQFTDSMGVMSDAVKDVEGAWDELNYAITNPRGRMSIFDQIVAIDDAWYNLQNTVAVSSEIIGDSLDIITNILDTDWLNAILDVTGVWGDLKSVFTGGIGVLRTGLTLVTQLVKGDFIGAWKTVQVLWTQIQSAASALFNFFSSAIPVVANLLVSGWGAAINTIGSLWKALPGVVSVAMSAMQAIAAGGMTAITAIFNGGVALISGLWNVLVAAFSFVMNMVVGQAAVGNAAVGASFASSATTSTSVWTSAGGVISGIISTIVSVAGAAAGAIGSFFSAAGGVIVSAFSALFSVVIGILQGIISAAIAFAAPFIAPFAACLAAVAVLWKIFGNVVFGIIFVIQDVVKGLCSFIGNAFKGAIDFVIGLWNGLVNFIKAAFNVISNAVSAVCNFFKSAWDGALNVVKNLFQAAANAIGSILQGIGNAINGVISALGNMVNYAAKAVGDVLGYLGKIGGNILGANNKINPIINTNIQLGGRKGSGVLGMGNFLGFLADGIDTVVNRPSVFVAGEAGAERVTVTPLGSKASKNNNTNQRTEFKNITLVAEDGMKLAEWTWNNIQKGKKTGRF